MHLFKKFLANQYLEARSISTVSSLCQIGFTTIQSDTLFEFSKLDSFSNSRSLSEFITYEYVGTKIQAKL